MWDFENYEEGAPSLRKRVARPRAPPKLSPPLYKASVKELAETGTIRVTSSTADLDNAMIQRIKKCLERANHPTTPEAEAKAALHLASRLMGQYNVSQAEILAHEPPSVQRQYAGQSVVSIRRVDGDESKTVNHQSYVDNLCNAMTDFFDCNVYTTSKSSSLELTFYGIAENTVAAAMSFEMAYNLIVEWARPYKGVGSKNSYLLGVSNELLRMAEKEKADEEAQAKKAETDDILTQVKQEEAEIQAQLGRLAPLPKTPDRLSSPESTMSVEGIKDNGFDGGLDSPDESADESSEGVIEPDFKVEDDYSINSFGDLDEEISKLVKPEPLSPRASHVLYSASPLAPRTQSNIPSPLMKEEPPLAGPTEAEQKSSDPQESELELESKWASHTQLVRFRATATKIADEYLKSEGVKLSSRQPSRNVIRDWNAYGQGAEDSKKIDVHRKRIKE